jgi:hypothetical protein
MWRDYFYAVYCITSYMKCSCSVFWGVHFMNLVTTVMFTDSQTELYQSVGCLKWWSLHLSNAIVSYELTFYVNKIAFFFSWTLTWCDIYFVCIVWYCPLIWWKQGHYTSGTINKTGYFASEHVSPWLKWEFQKCKKRNMYTSYVCIL